MICEVPLTVEELEKMTKIAKDINSSEEDIKKCLYDIEMGILNFPEIGLMKLKMLTTYQAVRWKLIECYEERFGEYQVQVKNTVTCRVTLAKGKNHAIFLDVKELKRNDINFLNKKNSGKNIIKKLELIRDSEDANLMLLSEEDSRWYSLWRENNNDSVNDVINNLKEIQEINGKIKVSRDFKYKIVVEVLE